MVDELKDKLKTTNPFIIAEHFGIKVVFWDSKIKELSKEMDF